ncbi:MAG: hypothetical protein VKP70_00350 [Cyanobacteriota bacterium]|nr:hypothetical protein [Cyanobacteriota bacterium]
MGDPAPTLIRAPGATNGLELRGHRHGRFQLVLHGSRLFLEGWCQEPGREPWPCSACLQPFDTPSEVAHQLLDRPSCSLLVPPPPGPPDL